ncbi:Hypothetical protein AA314_10003 [Archangium gephyra]|uniref:Tetratricopeptide repeat protein n=1 Tax=Archangium gephyra TaxID=48 RepID=A0AAC8QIM7_9BACT|nr:Hypothetical protein AA314_10003 [Archangium gephyra]
MLVLLLPLGAGAAVPSGVEEATRWQPPLVQLEGQPLSVGLLLVHADDSLLAVTPPDLLNVSGLVARAIQDYFHAAGGQVQVVDYTELGFQLWNRPRTKAEQERDPRALELGPWPGVPLGVKTALVTVVKVVRWELVPAAPDGLAGEKALLALLMSTWTREGQPVQTELIEVHGATGEHLLWLRSKQAAVALYEELRAPHRRPSPEDASGMFLALLHEAVGLHYFLLLPHEVRERLELVGREDEPGVRAFREGRHADALKEWLARAEADPKDHAALYNAARVLALRGEDRRALRLLGRARTVEDLPLYREQWQRVHQRVARMREIGAGKARPEERARREQAERSPARCHTVEREAGRDPRWTYGLGVELEEALLAEYHPAECDQPGVRCAIDSYQVRWNNGIWSIRYLPGLNDLDAKPQYDGTRRRMWSYFYDHTHRYRYCAR